MNLAGELAFLRRQVKEQEKEIFPVMVVLHQDGENTSHYVDSVGYREIPEFTKELSVSEEVTAEKAAVMEKTAEIFEEQRQKNSGGAGP